MSVSASLYTGTGWSDAFGLCLCLGKPCATLGFFGMEKFGTEMD